MKLFVWMIALALFVFLGFKTWEPLLPHHTGKMHFEEQELETLLGRDPTIQLMPGGLCLERFSNQGWDSTGVHLRTEAGESLNLDTIGSVSASLPGGLTPFASGRANVWAVDQKRRRVVQLAGESISPLPGSEVLGAAQCVIATRFDYIKAKNPGQGDEVFIASEPSHQGDALAIAHLRPDFTAIQPVAAKLELEHPTGLALSYDRKHLYIANEHSSTLEWLELAREDACSERWSLKGVLARFPLAKEQEHLFRGLIVYKTGMLIGSAPGGLVFLSAKGSQLGNLATPQEITYLVPAESGIYVALGSQLGHLPLAGASQAFPGPTPCDLDPHPPKPPARKHPRCHLDEWER